MDWNYTIAIATLIIAFCSLLDWLVSRSEEEQAKELLTEWFIKLDSYDFRMAVNGFHREFNSLFRAIYGPRVKSLRFIAVSALTSYFAIGIVSITFLAIGRFGDRGIENDVFAAMIGMSVLVNVWVDIASLIETRWILNRAEGQPIHKLFGYLVLDVIFSGSIFLVPFYILLSLGEGSLVPAGEVLRDIFSWTRSTEPHIQVMFISTYFTSVVFYTFMLSVLWARVIGLTKSRLLVIIEKLEKSNHLFKAIGGILTAILGVAKGIYEIS